MSIDNPTPHEVKLSEGLQGVAQRLGTDLEQTSGYPCGFILLAWPESTQATPATAPGEQPIASYIATGEREACALSMMELIAYWQSEQTLPPIHQMRDSSGRTFAEILGGSEPDTAEPDTTEPVPE